ncbi:ATP-binding cassette sub-family B member 9 isoform X2 [Carcharodon carcharias]|uniref:ATP-binding cassette sub-family B member 9 isoform X2 n=1 Tax=Carcharodon carcharias TaxID=13397 RepID=UPI001B7EDC03|nr:ATP-binding cassette sub-family B member 9 isoform X2 [Carcharodon carcharias]
MKVWQTQAYAIVFQFLDMVITTFLCNYVQDDSRFSFDIINFDISHSYFDLWAICILRVILIIGASIGVCVNQIDGPKRLKSVEFYISILCLLMVAYAEVKMLLYSETENFPNDPWFWSLFAWTLISSVATFHILQKFSCLKTSSTFTVDLEGGNGEDEKSLMSNAGQNEREKAKKNSNSISTAWRLLTYSENNTGLITGAFVFLLIANVGEISSPYFLGAILDGLSQKDNSSFNRNIIGMLLFTSVGAIAVGFREGLFNLALARLNVKIRNELFSSILQQEICFFDAHQTGEITSCLTSDATVVSDIISQNISLFLRYLAKAFGICTFMIILSWRLSMLAVIELPILLTFSILYGKSYKIFQVFLQLTTVLYGGHLVLIDKMTSGDLISIFLYQVVLADALQNISTSFTGLIQGIGVTENIFAYIDNKPTQRKIGTFIPETLKGEVTFKNVTFAYPNRLQNTILNNISFTLRPGEITALVGVSGSGKSSCVQLIENFYNPQAGKILLDDHSVEDYDYKYIHSKVAMVGQEPVLFARSIRKNISYGLQECSMDLITQASKTANAHEFITELKDGYDTEAGEKGTKLSGGQKQRVAIARALVRHPQVLLLDEATSALDGESECEILEELSKLKKHCTILIVAHRLSTVKSAQKIIVIKKGMVMEVGSHKELMQRKGTYFRMVQKQMPALESDNNN